MATTWGLLVEETGGFGRQRWVWAPRVIGHLRGTREQAMKALREEAARYRPEHPTSPKRRMLYADTDGFFLVVEGTTRSFHCRFTVAELLEDSAK
ncbi:hypothetical protein [Streptomyces oceani]|uniref:hypothetical protein n=1 Tax=Streptomyces oceani TaxID=1075402 RepID=UPI001112DFD8|nr:hypothetical protein [Streptomyces oceani]